MTRLSTLAIIRSCGLIALTGWLTAQPALAATYYVDQLKGSDTNDGLSALHSWQSIDKVNKVALQPGDTVLFDRTATWREQLNIPASGAPGKPITFGAYGSGAAPTIAGSSLLGDWTHANASTWYAKIDTKPVNIYVDDKGTSIQPLIREKAIDAVDSMPGSWYFDGFNNYVYVHLNDQSSANVHTIEASVRPFGIYSANHSYIVVKDISIRQTTQAGMYFEDEKPATGTEATNYDNNYNEFNTITGCSVHNVGGAGAKGWNGGGAPWDGGIYVRGYYRGQAPQPRLRGWTIAHNTIGRIDDTPILDYDKGGIIIRGATGAVIDGNNVATVNKFGITVREDFGGLTSSAPLVLNNVLGYNLGSIAISNCDGAIVSHNTIVNSSGFGIGIGKSSNALLTYNLICNVEKSADSTLYNGIDINAGSLNGRVFHNTISHVTSACLTLEGDNRTPSQGWIVENNLFDGRTNSTAIANQNSTIYIAWDVTDFKFYHNLYADTLAHRDSEFQHPSGTYFGKASFETLAHDSGSNYVEDPGFAGVDDYRLSANSPAIGIGVPIAGIGQPAGGKALNAGCF